MEEDRSALFNQLKNFSQRKLKKVETKVVTASGEQLVEKRGAKGLQVLSGSGANGAQDQDAEPARKLDLQVGLILPGFLIGSQDVAHDKSSLESYGVTHILNLDSNVTNKFEDDYNYKNTNIQDRPDFDLNKVMDDCFDFIDDGRHYGNVLVHCSGTIGLSRSTSICIAYLMTKENQKFDEAFNNVKEVRSFVKPNEGFIKQLKEYEVKLRGVQAVKESGIDDPFALRKKQEVEQEKLMVAGAASVKNRMKMFGATLDTSASSANSRSKSVSPSPFKSPASPASPAAISNRWSGSGSNKENNSNSISKSMTPEPRKSWQSAAETRSQPASSSGPPPPPPPMPRVPLSDEKPLKSSLSTTGNNKSSALPPPPPPPIPGDLLKGNSKTSQQAVSDQQRRLSIESHQGSEKQRTVFGRVPPPSMKIRGGLSIERQDSLGDKNQSATTNKPKSSLKLPLKKQFTHDSGSENEAPIENPRAPSPSAALRVAKQQVAAKQSGGGKNQTEQPSSLQDHHRPSVCSGQLNRSSTKKLLNLIKTKTKTDLTLADGDENDEIEALLGALESETIENIDWDELGLDEDEVKDIIQKGGGSSSASDSSSSSDGSEDDDEEEEIEEVETTTQHFVIRSK